MTGLGARLKEARVAKGYTLDDLQGMTKIQKRYLSGIENEDYSMMPGAFYIRAFIKQYAEAVDLDADEMLALYKEESGSVPEPERETVTPPPLQRSGGLKSNSRLKEVMPKVIVALFIVMIIVVVYILFREKAADKSPESDNASQNVPAVIEQPSENPEKEPAVDKDEPAEEPADDAEDAEEPAEDTAAAGQVEFQSSSGETSTFKLTDSQQLKLVINTSGDSWISVTDQAGTERMPQPGGRIMTTGESVEIDAADAASLRIRVGRTNSTELVINGQTVEYQNDLQTQNIIIQKP
ncbi:MULTISPECIES: helix-turn-helix domain-containing protein [unclassified Sporosarcina]|uniref:helix-turn-helix domain-containing protein n=1 Tax=unclassified Sporosarcina TaxID=2647733 RepID=UPI00203E967E|nr:MULTISPECIES: helix-turn-helix domain-containing protein [unclassified Sporosarcina]GKV64127.1 XRE family transcriptional regulator [Sporosarcina sp. NCCP-2331]GLB54408.1 XRE family transcriptional regulator [Sporosarcina sp. NCCP-2378]